MASLPSVLGSVPRIVLQSRIARLIIPSIFALIGIALVSIGAGKVLDYRRAVQNFVSVDAVILESELDSGPERTSRTYMPAITYEYTYDGEEYRSKRVHPGGTWATGNEDRMKAIVDRYRPGDRATAYCDPENPDESYLEEGKLWHAYLALGAGLALVLLMIGVGLTVV